ncbi:hypothetical protein [Microseira wollei]|uniref:Uncharacterized protein n=1 Tax=Microseira wollei NIES-4236 TaxID=2530354 RepID=A0AAV3XR74_9CYAN|nr:hypothetical protein [Microseira wollei]GET44540.1 hypothetical protein MiSe_93700 [Microseira wollei NIES-4236]
MREPIALTGSSQAILTASTGNAQVECFSARPIYDKIKFQIGDDYYALVQLFVASFDIASNIVSLSPAALPDLRDLDNRTEQATKIYNNWLNYEKVGIQLLSDDGGGLFRKQGQPIVLQNIPFQLPIQHLRPYLSATQEVLLVGESERIGAQVLSDLGYKQLSGRDEVLIKTQCQADIKLIEIKEQSINNWYPIGINLPANEPVIVRPFNNRRRALYVVNAELT